MFGSLGSISGGGGVFSSSPDLLAFDRYRNQLDDWVAVGVPDRPSLLQRFIDATYFSRDNIVTADFAAFLAATSGTSTRASTGTMLNSAGNLVSFATNVPRITDRGLLIEGATTNLALQSETLDVTSTWQPGNMGTTVADAAVAPDGTMTMDKIVDNTTASVQHYREQLFTGLDDNAVISISCFVKQADWPTACIAFYARTAAYIAVTLDFSAKTISTAGTATYTAARLQDCGNGIYRLMIDGLNVATGATNPRIRLCKQITTYTGDGTGGYFWGAQVEVNPFVTSYVKTTIASATRAADNLSWTRSPVTAFSRVIRARMAVGSSVTTVAFQIDDGTSSNRIYIARQPNKVVYMTVFIGGVVTDLNLGTVADDTDFAVAFRAANNDFAASLNGGAVVTNTSLAMPSGLVNERLGTDTTLNFNWNSRIYSAAEFPTLLSNTKLQALSAL